MFTNLVESE